MIICVVEIEREMFETTAYHKISGVTQLKRVN